MTDEQKPADWVDFVEVKALADVDHILTLLGLREGLEDRGKELIGWCPLGKRRHGKRDSFNFNREKKVFKCHACNQRGSIIDFVSRFEDIALKVAARRVQDLMSTETSPDAAQNSSDDAKTNNPAYVASTAENASQSLTEPNSDSLDDDLRVTLTLKEAVQLVKSRQRRAHEFVVIDKVTFDLLKDVIA